MDDATGTRLLALAAQRHGDPHRVLRGADAVLEDLATTPADRALADWVRGLALHELGDTVGAVAAFRESMERARAAGADDAEARASANLAVSLVQLGETNTAVDALARARAVAPHSARGLVTYLDGLVEQRTGNHDRALQLYAEALPLLTAVGDRASVAGLYLNRGVLSSYRNEQLAASADFGRAEKTARAEGLGLLEAMAAHNRGFALGRLGALPAALDALDRARAGYTRLDSAPRQLPVLDSDRAEVLLSAGLFSEARRAAEAAVEALTDSQNVADLTEARLLLARVCLWTGDLAAARRNAVDAAWAFRRGGRRAWAVLALSVALQAEVWHLDHKAPPTPRLLERCSRAAEQLRRAGWTVEADDARCWAARLAVALDDVERAGHELAQIPRGVRSLAQQVNRLHAVALVATAQGDRTRAQRALSAAIRAVDAHRNRIGSTQARVEAAELAAALARFGLASALHSGRPATIFRWAELLRASVLRLAPVSPAPDSPLTVELDRLRSSPAVVDVCSPQAISSSSDEAHRGPPQRGDREQAVLEQAVLDHALRLHGSGTSMGPTASLAAVRRGLHGRTLVEYLESDGELFALVVTARRRQLVDLGAVEPVVAARSFLDFALERLLRQGGRAAARARAGFDRAAAELDALLVVPLGSITEDVVVVPTGRLHGLAWPALPTLRDRDLCVAPSATLWLARLTGPHEPDCDDPGLGARDRAAPSPVRLALICGPDLPGAAAEVAVLASRHPGAVVLTGVDATVARTIATIEQADLVHLAAHGRFRSDSPMFSSLRLADGPLTVYDLERLRRVPAAVVLTACDAGTALVTGAEQLLGTASALLSIGVGSVVAPIAPVPDDASVVFATTLHAELAAGATLRRASRRASEATAAADPVAGVATGSVFLTIGAG